jgi:hypothetical protein
MRCPAGVLIPKEGTEGLPKWAKFHNWPRDADGSPLPDAPGFPAAKDIPEKVVEVQRDHHHAIAVFKWGCTETKAPKPPKAPSTPKVDK